MPAVSIVLPVYNGERYLREALDSILGQSFNDWELICVNDCSTDTTPAILEEYRAKDGRISIINNDINQKLPRSLNIGFAAAKGEFFTWTSDDNVYLPKAIETMRDFLVTNPTCPMVTADMEIIDSEGAVGERVNFERQTFYVRNSVGACFMYRRSVYEKIGGYDVDKFLVEDYDYWLRIWRDCGEIRRIPQVLYRYRRHDNSLSITKMQLVRQRHINLIMDYLAALPSVDDEVRNAVGCFYLYAQDWGIALEPYEKQIFSYAPYLKGLIKNISPTDKLVIFGAGEMGTRALDEYKSQVVAFADNSPKKQGTVIDGVKVYSLNDVTKLFPKAVIMIAMNAKWVYSVMTQLTTEGIEEYAVYQYYSK